MALKFEKSGEKPNAHSKKKRRRNLSFYVAVALCAGAVVFTAVANRADSGRSAGEPALSGQNSPLPFDNVPPVDETLIDTFPAFDVKVSNADARPDRNAESVSVNPVTTSPSEDPAPSRMNLTQPTEAAVPAAADITFRMPTGGSVVSGFSGDELIFCATMCDWRVHNGIDISGSEGEEVLACTGGIVEGFAADMLYGNTAIVRLPDDSVMYYSGLSDTQMVSEGLQVNPGDVIGYIGVVPCEMQDAPHIHLSMIKDGQFIDPAPLLSGR